MSASSASPPLPEYLSGEYQHLLKCLDEAIKECESRKDRIADLERNAEKRRAERSALGFSEEAGKGYEYTMRQIAERCNVLYSTAGDVCQAVEKFIAAWCRVSARRDELERQAALSENRANLSQTESDVAAGCEWLYGLYQVTFADPPPRSKCIAAWMAGGESVGASMLTPMRKAADYLMQWAEEKASVTPATGKEEQGKEAGATDLATSPTAETKQGEGTGAVGEFCFAHSGSGYFIKGFGQRGYVRQLKGFEHIAALLKMPGQSVLMRELLQENETRIAVESRSRQQALDDQAKREAYNRLQEVKQELENARQENNTVEQQHCEEEVAHLTEQLKAAVGIGGKSRDLNSEADKLRPRIYANLSRAYKALRDAKPPMNELANHFEAAIGAEGPAYIYRPSVGEFCWSFDLPHEEVAQ